MQSFLALAAIAGVAQAWNGNYSLTATSSVAGSSGVGGGVPVTTTKVLTTYTQVCPTPTTVTQDNKTYTVTSVSDDGEKRAQKTKY